MELLYDSILIKTVKLSKILDEIYNSGRVASMLYKKSMKQKGILQVRRVKLRYNDVPLRSNYA